MEKKKKMLVTGTSGFVGSRAVNQLRGKFEIVQIPSKIVHRVDRNAIREQILALNPDFIINPAAVSDIGYAEAHNEESYMANVELPVCLAKVSKEIGAKFINFSSDQVYSGEEYAEFFTEEMALNPSNTYGRHKLEGEKRVLDINPDSVMLRATWMYDLVGYFQHVRGNLVTELIKKSLKGEEAVFSANDYRGITYVRQVIDTLIPTLSIQGGAYNFGSENKLSMYETALDFARVLGIKVNIRKDEAKRSLNINCDKLKKAGIFFDTTSEGIRRMTKDYGIYKI